MKQLNLRQLFPLGKAYGDAFCNRVNEVSMLKANVESGKHTFLVAPRRYGKSSLCERTFEKTDLPWAKMDFYLAVSEKDAERIILNAITDLISKTVGSVEKLVKTIKQYAKKLKPKFSFTVENFRLELEVTADATPAENIAEALLLLEKLLVERNKRAILLFDEFQEIGELAQGRSIEGAIRHAAQETRHLSLIFSGSNPHLLNNMFEDERRPLYKLCRKLILDRIHEQDYKNHLAKAAKKMWGNQLSDATFQYIMYASERHPYYVNYLCDELWSDCRTIPKVADVQMAWLRVVEEEKSDLVKDFSALSENQRKLMIYIATYGGNNLYSNEVAKRIDIGASSISRALSALLEKDYIEKVGDDYRLIVPAYKSLLALK